MTKRKLIQVALAVAATLVAGYFVLARLSLPDLRKLLEHADARWLGVALVLYLLANLIRAMRFQVLLGGQVSTLTLWQVVVTQNFLNTFLPLRAGELSYLYLIHKTGAVAPGENLASLVGARLLDLVAAVLIPLAALPLSSAWSSHNRRMVWLAALAAAVALAIAAVTALAVVRAEGIAAFIERKLPSGEGRSSRGLRHLAEAVRALGLLRSRHVAGRVIALTFAGWLLLYVTSFAAFQGTGLAITVPDAVFVSGFPALAGMTPFYMFGGFGVYEGSVAFGLTLVGHPMERALAASVLAHLAELAVIVLPAIPIPLFRLLAGKRRAVEESR